MKNLKMPNYTQNSKEENKNGIERRCFLYTNRICKIKEL
jgi:hypothetical protein